MISLDQMLDMAESHARNILLIERKKELIATFMLVDPQGEATIIGCPWDGEIEKQIALAVIRAKAREINAVMLSHVSEAWFSPPYKTQAEVDAAPPPSQSPDRREAVIALATDGVATKARIFMIERDWKGKIAALTSDPKIAGDSFAGRMIDGILPIGGTA